MIERPLVTYSLLNYLWEKNLDILDTYVPLVCSCISKKNTSEITRKTISELLSEGYGISGISMGACENIIRRMIKKKIVTSEKGKSFVNVQQLILYVEKNSTQNGGDNYFNDLIKGIIGYAENQYSQNFAEKEVENGLLAFLQNYDGDILFQEEALYNTLGKQTNDKINRVKLKFIISQYLIYCSKSDKGVLTKMVSLAKGHALATLISMNDLSNYQGKLTDVRVALDSPIIYNILGLSEEGNLELTKELMGRLKELGAKFVLFEDNLNEVKNTLISVIHLLTKGNYNLEQGSRLLRFAVRNRITSAQMQLHLQQLDSTLQKWNITTISSPGYKKGYKEIDNEKLTKLISDIYKKKGNNELHEYQKNLIATDVDTISYIYRLRGNSPATNLKNCQAILLTNNTAIAYASKHPELSCVKHTIPPCMTDVFLSTILWTNFPKSNNKLNERLLMCECSRNINIDENILRRFYSDVKDLYTKNIITNEQVLLVNTSTMVYKLIEEKTFNDEELYTDKTAEEILQELEIERKKETNKLRDSLETHDKNFKKTAKVFALLTYWCIWVILLAILIMRNFVDLIDWSTTCKRIYSGFCVLFCLWGLLCHSGIIPSKANIIKGLEGLYYKGIIHFAEKK